MYERMSSLSSFCKVIGFIKDIIKVGVIVFNSDYKVKRNCCDWIVFF